MSLAYIFDEISVVTILDFILLRKHDNKNRNEYQSFDYYSRMQTKLYYAFPFSAYILNERVEFVTH